MQSGGPFCQFHRWHSGDCDSSAHAHWKDQLYHTEQGAGSCQAFCGKLKGLVLMVVRNFACWYLPRRYLLFVIDLILGSEISDPVPSCPIPIILTSSNFETMTETQVTMCETGQVLATVETVMVQLDTSLTKAVPLTCRATAAVVEASISLHDLLLIIEYIDICICMIIFSLCMFSIVKFVLRTMIYANVPRWYLHKHLLWLYGGLPMVIYFFVWLCMIGDCRCYHCWLVLQNQWLACNWYKPGKWCGDVTNVGLLSNSRLPYPCFRIVEGGLPLHEIYARSIHRWEWPKS